MVEDDAEQGMDLGVDEVDSRFVKLDVVIMTDTKAACEEPTMSAPLHRGDCDIEYGRFWRARFESGVGHVSVTMDMSRTGVDSCHVWCDIETQ
jgi:hypothetical protein